jgi:hypothetical protein
MCPAPTNGPTGPRARSRLPQVDAKDSFVRIDQVRHVFFKADVSNVDAPFHVNRAGRSAAAENQLGKAFGRKNRTNVTRVY